MLLHLIRQNRMDINDIPMAEITAQYIDYLHQMQTLQLDVCWGVFGYGAMLLNIKSKMLLPTEQEQVEEFEEDYEDPLGRVGPAVDSSPDISGCWNQLQVLATERQKQYSREQATIPADAKLGKLSDEELSTEMLQHAFCPNDCSAENCQTGSPET